MTTIYHEQGFDEDKYFGNQVACPTCGGLGYWMDMHYVTKDMAIDACEPSMEGMSMEEKVKCTHCNGEGWVITTEPISNDEIPY